MEMEQPTRLALARWRRQMRVWDKDRHPEASLSLLSYLMSQYIDVLVMEPKSILVCNITRPSKTQPKSTKDDTRNTVGRTREWEN